MAIQDIKRDIEEFELSERAGITPGVVIGVIVLLFVSALFFIGIDWPLIGLLCLIAMVACIVAGYLGLRFVSVNEKIVHTFLGTRYVGTLSSPGIHVVWPWYSPKKIATSTQTSQIPDLKVSDLNGNPIEIAAVFTWNIENAAKSRFCVENIYNFIDQQSESALRTIASRHPYETMGAQKSDIMTLRGHDEEISKLLAEELGVRLAAAGIIINNARITRLAYAPEIASAMLRKQHAGAVLAAREQILEGVVTLVQRAVTMLENGVEGIKLDPERKAAMASNLMTIMVGEKEAQAVLNVGTLHN